MLHISYLFLQIGKRLPQYVVEATSGNMFKNRLDKHWKDMGVYSWLALQFIISKYKYKLCTQNVEGFFDNPLKS